MDLVELSRRLENLIRIGTIHSVDHAAVRCRVQSGHLLTQWLPWFTSRAGETTSWDPPTIGEQAMVFSPSGEAGGGIVLYGLNSDAIGPPSHSPENHVIRFPDGATFSYDHAAGHLDISGIRSATVEAANTLLFKAGDSVTFDTPLVRDTGKHTTEGLLTYRNGIAGRGGRHGNAIYGDFIHYEGILSSNDIVLHQHGHVDPAAGMPI